VPFRLKIKKEAEKRGYTMSKRAGGGGRI